MYVGTVLLRMTERQFWKCTPRRLQALSKVYTEHQGGNGTQEDAPRKVTGFIDQVL